MMPSDHELLRSLDDEPRKPSTVDIERAIADGRRRHRARRAAGYTGAAAVTALAVAGASVAGGLTTQAAPGTTAAASAKPAGPSPAPKARYTIPGTAGWSPPAATAPTRCTLNRLPTPDDAPMALISGADPSGRYLVGRSYPKSGGYQAVIWHDGQPRKVTLPGDVEESLRDVNSAGTAVGWSYAGSAPVPYVYRDGKAAKLPGVRRGSAYAINEAGAIAGDDGRAALIWPSATANPMRLPVPAGTSRAEASDIDEDGTTVGSLDDKRPYVWFPDGTHRELTMPTLDGERAADARVFTIRNGWATGLATSTGDGSDPAPGASAGAGGKASTARTAAIRWNVRTGEVREYGELQIRASTANAQGWQVGTDRQGRAVLVTDARTVVLPDLARHEPGDLQNIATTLSDDGRTIGGQSDDATGTIQAVVWRCQ